jgi:hypothetical protein
MTDRTTLLRRAVLTWILFVPVAILNGVFREKALRPAFGERSARQASSVMLSILYVIVAWAMMRRLIAGTSTRTLIGVGAGWASVTSLFDFGFGHFVDQKSWSELASDYNLVKGRLWSVNLLTIFLTPHIVKCLPTPAPHGESPE